MSALDASALAPASAPATVDTAGRDDAQPASDARPLRPVRAPASAKGDAPAPTATLTPSPAPAATASPQDTPGSWRFARVRRGRAILVACAGLLIVAFVLALGLGPVAIGPRELLAVALAKLGLAGALGEAGAVAPVKTAVVEAIRAPRAVLALAAGAALGATGATMQGVFRNPLADPTLIGVSSGGAVAAVAVIVLGAGGAASAVSLPVAAFAGSLAAVALIYAIAHHEGRVVVATMLLAGVAANALAFSGIGYLTFLANDEQLRTLTFWTLGSFGGATWAGVAPAVVVMAVAAIGLQTLARPLNCMLLGEADARHLGVNVESVKRRAAVLTALGVGAAVAVAGVIGFVGLVTPHLVRLMAGPDHRYVLPGSALLGGALLLAADVTARLAVQPAELPLGVVTAAIGAPFFLWLLLRDKRRGVAG